MKNKNITTLNFKLRIENFDEFQEKVNEIKKLIDEINKIELELSIENDELKNISDCAKEKLD